MEGGAKLITQKQRAALQALMQFTSRKEAAAAAGVAERTLREYLRDEAFVAELNRLYDDWMDECTRELQQAVKMAIQTLKGSLSDEAASVPAKIAAAKAILETAPKYLELNNIIQRIDALEKDMERKD